MLERASVMRLLRKKRRYFGHQSRGIISDHFGHVGPRIEVGFLMYHILKFFSYRTSVEEIKYDDDNQS